MIADLAAPFAPAIQMLPMVPPIAPTLLFELPSVLQPLTWLIAGAVAAISLAVHERRLRAKARREAAAEAGELRDAA